MIDYVVDRATERVHKIIDGRVLEQCNIDDIRPIHKTILKGDGSMTSIDLAEMRASGYKLCLNCFPDQVWPEAA